MYTSKTIQNELIEICGDIIVEDVVNRVSKAKVFSVLADETTDVSCLEQLSLSVRYVNDNVVREDFLKFDVVTDLSGTALADTIRSALTSVGLNITQLVGQGYDGASAMSGKFNGVQAIIRETCPAALYIHCAAHCLNLTITKASEVQSIRNCFGTIGATATFFSSPLCADCLKKQICQAEHRENQRTKLVSLCETRWVEKHEAVSVFVQLLPHVRTALSTISETFRDHNTIAHYGYNSNGYNTIQ